MLLRRISEDDARVTTEDHNLTSCRLAISASFLGVLIADRLPRVRLQPRYKSGAEIIAKIGFRNPLEKTCILRIPNMRI